MDNKCVLCERTDVRLAVVRLVPESRLTEDMAVSGGCIEVCLNCRPALAIDPTVLCTKDIAKDHDARTIAFLTTFIQNAWEMDRSPSFQELANALNLGGMYNSSGNRWSYHNLRQKLLALGFDKDEIHATSHARRPSFMNVASAVEVAVKNGAVPSTAIPTPTASPFGDGGVTIG